MTVTDPGSPLRSSVTLASTAGSERGIATVRYQTAPAGTSTWTDACTASSAPLSCSFDTTAVADGLRDVRAIATDTAGYTRTSATVASRRVDNTLPTVSLADPGAYLTGTKTLSATASDAGSGLAGLQIDYRPAGGSWTTACSGTTSPRSCALNTSLLIDGSYELRARATDAAGNVADSALTRVVDNNAPTGSVPALTPLRGTVDISLTADDGAGSGVASVTGQFRQAGGSTWTDVCTDTTAPYACTGLDTTPYPDGLYEAREIVVDKAGFSTTSAIVSVRIDNTAPTTATLNRPGHLAVRQRLAQRHRGRRRLGHRHLDGPVPRLGRQHVDRRLLGHHRLVRLLVGDRGRDRRRLRPARRRHRPGREHDRLGDPQLDPRRQRRPDRHAHRPRHAAVRHGHADRERQRRRRHRHASCSSAASPAPTRGPRSAPAPRRRARSTRPPSPSATTTCAPA